ncbi:hypothetical protein [Salmonella enterica]|uniref:hypothetical protein n=1 Tax=Salmonella enterica TaxID=28901 RepID=UPI00178C2E88|nr:hypothetical protein [Salmonella enterica]
MSTTSSAIPSLTAGARRSAGRHRFEWNGEHRLVRFTDVRHYDDEGFPRHSWRYEFDNGVTTLYPCPTRKSSVSSLLITPLS